MRKRLLMLSVYVMICLFMLVACSNSDNAGNNAGGNQTGNNQQTSGNGKDTDGTGNGNIEENFEDVTLIMHQRQNYFSDEQFTQLIAEPVKAKYPHITVELLDNNNTQDLITIGQQMDLVVAYNGIMPETEAMGLLTDIEPYVKKLNFDLEKFKPDALQSAKDSTKSGTLYGFPYSLQLFALYYNKDIFDTFGAEYPTDGMTFNEVIELSRKVARFEDGVQYIGYDPSKLFRVFMPFGKEPLNIDNTTSVNTDESWRTVFQTAKKIFEIEANIPPNGKVMTGSAVNRFIRDRNVAMLSTVNLFERLANQPDLNWDVVQYPSYEELPDVFGYYNMQVVNISSTSKHKEDAMRVLEVMYSDEVQLKAAHMGVVSPMKDPIYEQEFLKDLPGLEGKNIQGPFKSRAVPAPLYSEYYNDARFILEAEFQAYVEGTKDLNTALRDAEEKIKLFVAEMGE